MAIITPSSTISEIRGSIGDETFSKNHYRPYVKARVSPVQPDTAKQISSRGSISNLNNAWRSLSENDRLRWINFAAETFSTARLSERHKLTGYSAFARAYLAGFYGNGSTSGVPVKNTPVPVMAPVVFEPNGQFGKLTISFLTAPTNYGISMFFSRPVLPSIMSPNSVPFFRLLSFVNNEQSFEIEYGQIMLAEWGINLDDFIDQKLFIRFRTNDWKNGTVIGIQTNNFINVFA